MKNLVLSLLIAMPLYCATARIEAALVFEKNAGQADPAVRFLGRNGHSTFWLTDSAAVLSIDGKGRRAVLRMAFDGAKRHPVIEGQQKLPGRSNYFIGRGASSWRTNVEQFAAVRYRDVYPGIDLLFHVRDRAVEYDWAITPGADVHRIQMSFEGADQLRIDSSGDLVASIGGVEIRERRPRAFQGADGESREVASRFVRHGREVGFETAAYDRSQVLTIDPVLVYATYLGGGGSASDPNVVNAIGDEAIGVAIDSQGNVIVTGQTESPNFPTKNGLFPTRTMLIDAFVTKFNPNASGGNSVIWSTYFGGTTDDTEAHAVAVDSQNNVYFTGLTFAFDFPVKNAFQSVYLPNTNCLNTTTGKMDSCDEAFVTKINSAGNAIVYSSYLGGDGGQNVANRIAVSSSGLAWVTGVTQAPNFPVQGQYFQSNLHGTQNAFVSEVNADGSQLLFSSYLGGNSLDAADGIALDASGNAYVTGGTVSPDFPTTSNAYLPSKPSPSGLRTGFVSEINPNASPSLVYSTYLGGKTAGTLLLTVTVDAKGNIYAGGQTACTDFPITANAIMNSTGALANATIGVFAELNPNASGAAQLVYGTYLTGGFSDQVGGIAVDKSGRIVVAGNTKSPDFPTTSDTFQTYYGTVTSSGFSNVLFLSVINPAMSGSKALAYSTLFGGSSGDILDAMALDSTGTVAALAGISFSNDMFVTPGAYQSKLNETLGNALIAVFNLSQTGPVITGMLNAASFDKTAAGFAPGEIVTLFGTGLGLQTIQTAALDSTGHLATTLAGCQLLVNNIPAPLVYVLATQVSAILPYELTPRDGTHLQNYAQMVCNGVPGNTFGFVAVPAAPGIFSAASSGIGQVAALNQDGSYNSSTNPAGQGSIVTIFATGEGVLTPTGQDGRIENGALATIPKAALSVSATIGGVVATSIPYAGVAPGEVDGLFQVNVQVPTGLTAGSVPIVLTIGKAPSQNNLTIAVK